MKRLNLITGIFCLSVFLYSCSGTNTTSEEEVSEASDAIEEVSEEETPAANVFFISPADGDTVFTPLIVEMGIEGMEVDPAGEIKEGMGHHHLIINGTFIEEGQVVPTDPMHIHYGLGQTSDTIELEPGEYTLTLQFADGVHQSYGEPLSNSIRVVVQQNN